jgi:hypothetical protein
MGRANHTLCNSASGYGRSWFFSAINANIALAKAFKDGFDNKQSLKESPGLRKKAWLIVFDIRKDSK